LPFALVLGIANLITFHGDSVALFEAALHAAVAGYVDACRRLGDAPEKFAMAAWCCARKAHSTLVADPLPWIYF
jgi:hypothetical protein